MKKTLLVIMAALMAVFTGCKKELPTPEKFETITQSIGTAAGYVANQTKINDKSRNAVITIIGEVSNVTPKENQSFEDAWTPVAKEVVAKLIADKKIDEGSSALVLATFNVACKGLDYIFNIRYPKAKTYTELVNAAVRGFTGGFLTTFKPVNTALAAAPANMDKEAYEYLTK